MRATWIVFAILCMGRMGVLPAAPATETSSPGCAPVCSAIRSAVHARLGSGIEFDDSDVKVLGNMTGQSPEAISVERINVGARNGIIEARLKCANAACLPFYAFVTPRAVTGATDRKLDFYSPLRLAREERCVGSSVAPQLRAGSRMLLVVFTPTMRLWLPAVSLETRHMGEAVRVRPIGNSRVFQAVVRGPGLAVAQEP